MRTKTTILDVAREAGVSKVTVSYVLNGLSASARISAPTEERVLEAARSLKYRPNAVARTLATRRSGTLAVVLQSGDLFSNFSGFTTEVMRGVCAAAVNCGYDLMLHTSPAPSPVEDAYRLMDGRADGALVLRDGGDPILSELAGHDFPCVQFFTRSDDPKTSFVDSDNREGGRLAAEHLLNFGHRQLAMIEGPSGSVSSALRRDGYVEALTKAGLPESANRRISVQQPGDWSDTFRALMTEPDRPTAIFAWSDEDAIKCIKALQSMGIGVPSQVSVIGFDSLPSCETCTPKLTSIAQPIFDMAASATELLIDLSSGPEPQPRKVIFPVSLQLRQSTGPAPLESL